MDTLAKLRHDIEWLETYGQQSAATARAIARKRAKLAQLEKLSK